MRVMRVKIQYNQHFKLILTCTSVVHEQMKTDAVWFVTASTFYKKLKNVSCEYERVNG